MVDSIYLTLSVQMLTVSRNAGGRTSDLTSELVKTCQSLIGIETCMHLTCTNMPREKVDIALRVSLIPDALGDLGHAHTC